MREASHHYWKRDRDGNVRLLASMENGTEKYFFPPISQCSPLARQFKDAELSPLASVYSFTWIHPNPKTGAASFCLIYADFPEKVRVLGRMQLPPGVRPAIGDIVRVEIDEADAANPQYLFVPALRS
jgi:uncharacterized OB-fold protein